VYARTPRKASLFRTVQVVLLLLVALAVSASAVGAWTRVTQNAPGSVGLMMLLPDGTVLAHNGNTTSWYRLTPDAQGHYVNGTWTTVTASHDSRLYYSSQILTDGRLFVAGGEYGTGGRLGEIYDPLTNSWKLLPAPNATFSDANSEILPDGRVLCALVQGSLQGTIIYNPVTNAWTAGPNSIGIHNESAWVKLPDDSILMVDRNTRNSERYIPASNTWIVDGGVPVSLYDPYGLEKGGGLLLPDGRVFMLGSTGKTALYTPTGTTAPGTWAAGPDIPNASGTPDAPCAMLVNGKVLCAVSPVPTSGNHFPTPTTFYEYDYVTNSFAAVPTPTGGTLNHPSYYGTMLVLPDGTALYSDFASVVYSYQPDGTPLAQGKPVVSTVTQNADGTFHIVGTQLNGISEGSCYGDDNQNATNYPLVRLTSGTTVNRARTFNWSRTSVATGNTPVSTEFVLPAGLASGTYSLTVVANGISSDPVSFPVNPIQVVTPVSALEGSAPVSASITLPSAPAADLTVSLTSSVPGRATVPATVTVLAGQTTASFSITIVNDALINGPQAVGISAAAAGYQTGLSFFNVLDNDTALLTVTPTASYSASGLAGGPFTPATNAYTLTNAGTNTMSWTATKVATWLTLSPASGTLAGGANVTVTATINSAANSLAIGSYSDTLTFTNTTTGDGTTTRSVFLTVSGTPVLVVSAGSLNSAGPVGGSFNPASTSFTVQNTGTGTLSWTAAKTAGWLTISPSSGSVAAGGSTTVTATINSAANSLAQAAYTDTITFTNTSNGNGDATRSVSLLVQQRLSSSALDTDPGWTRQGEWAWGTPTGGGGVAAGGAGNVDPTTGFTGTKVFGVNLAGNYALTVGGPYYLTAGPFNLTGSAASKLRFRRWLNTDLQPFAYATVEVSNNGTTWTSVFDNGSSAAITDSSWQQMQYDISSIADNRSGVYVRWGYQVGASASAYSGWNIDDVEMLGTTNATTPTATPQTLAGTFNSGTTVTLTGVDTNIPAQPLTFAVATSPAHGNLTGAAPNLTYIPAIGFQGADSFTFTATNTFNLTSAPATVTINVPKGVPAANTQSVSVPTDTATAFNLSGSDPDVPPLPLSYTVLSQPSHGTLSGAAPSLTYTPAAGFQGADSFTFSVSNGANASAPATVSLGVGVISVVESAVTSAVLGNNPRAPMIVGADGNFYGTTAAAGSSNLGTIFRMTPAGALSNVANFYGANGASPLGGLLLAGDGNYYGTTSAGGATNLGTIFRMTPAGTLTTLVHLSTESGTSPRAALIQAADGNLYGATSAGGAGGFGTVFKVTPAGVLTVLVNFTGATGSFPGSSSQAPLVQGTDTLLYGTTSAGGTSNLGTVFKLTTTGTFTSLASFTGTTGVIGSTPLAGLIQAVDGSFYGTASAGGSGVGVVFKMTSAGVVSNLLSFNGTNGSTPQGALFQAADGLLYGTTRLGGTNSVGTVFKISTGGALTTLRSFSSTSDGSNPYAGLVQGADGNLYGTASLGGASATGVVFNANPSNSAFTRVASFPIAPPWFRGLLSASDGSLYGFTAQGGANSVGSVFKFTPGGGSSTLVSFNTTNGSLPTSLIEGSDGNLYGTTQSGGTSGLGTVFRLTTGGTLTTLVNFTGTTGAALGTGPVGWIMQAADGFLYGTTQTGGNGGVGTIFKVSTGGAFTSILSFTGISGASPGSTPQTRLVQAADGTFYGTTSSGGATAGGTVFKMTAGVLTTLVNFTGNSGAAPGTSPSTNLLLATDGNLYGTTTSGGLSFGGTAYRVTPAAAFTSLVNFTGTGGANPGNTPTTNLVQAGDGNLYGTTSGGGSSSSGTVYKISLAGAFTSVASFTGATGALPGSAPFAALLPRPDGWLYGTTSAGGPYGVGTAFRVSAVHGAQLLYSFGTTDDGGSCGAGQTTLGSDNYRMAAASDGFLYGVNQSAVFRVHQQPSLQSIGATAITATGATLTAGFIPNQDAATLYFEYGVTTAYGSQTAPQNLAFGQTLASIPAGLTGLQSGAIYHFRVITVTTQGTFYSGDQAFATTGPPLVITGAFAAVGQNGASVDGLINPLGFPTTYWFEYGDEPDEIRATYPYDVSRSLPVDVNPTPGTAGGLGWLGVRVPISPIAASGVYYVRLVAENDYGITYGDLQVVNTLTPTSDVVQPVLEYASTGTGPTRGLFRGNDGLLYGTTPFGGTSSQGTVFTLTPGGTLTTLGNFYGSTNGGDAGAVPLCDLVQGFDGAYYGTTNAGGTGGFGTIFTLTPGGASTLVSFGGTAGNLGAKPFAGLTLGPDGTLYGCTTEGGSSSLGTIFKLGVDGAFTSLASFTGTGGANPGSAPSAGVVLGGDGNLYGTTKLGGGSNLGTIFKITPAGTLTTLAAFTGVTGATPGAQPTGALLLANDGNFYGTTSAGGAGNLGTIFRMSPGGVVTTLVNFTGTSGAAPGSSPKGALLQGPDGNLYGTTQTGGSGGGFGTLYKLTPGGVLTTLINFSGTSGGALGASPNGGLVVLEDGSFYGLTQSGGLGNAGTAFKMSAGGVLTTLVHLYAAPVIGKLAQAPDSRFFGTTVGGGFGFNSGTVFAGQPADAIDVLAQLAPTSSTPVTPRGALVKAVDGSFWGCTAAGGSLNLGTVFKITPAGVFTTVLSFTGTGGSNPGSAPYPLILGSDGNFWGMTNGGGTSDNGTVYKVTPAGVQTVVIEFKNTQTPLGSRPKGALLLAADGNYYGSTSTGPSLIGTLFKLTPAGVLTTLTSFVAPTGQFVQAADGNFYGTADGGGLSGLGTVFRMTPAGATTILASFGGASPQLPGRFPAGLSMGPDGFLYGVTGDGGAYNLGTLFRVTTGGIASTIHSFTGRADGRTPADGLITASDGFMYGATSLGIYRLNPPPAVFSAPATNTTATSATLGGSIVPEAFDGTYVFEYGPTAAYGLSSAASGYVAGLAALPVSMPVSNLQPLLTYHYRVVVHTALGDFAGPDSTFTTSGTATFQSADSIPVTVSDFTASGFSLALTLGFAPAPGTVLTLVNNTGAAPVNGLFTGVPDGGAVTATYLGQTYLFQINYAGGDGNDITLTAVSQVITFPAIPPKALTDPAFTLGASSTSGLPITYSIVAGSSAASVSGGQVTLTGTAGVVTVKASQAGNGSFGPALDAFQTFTVSAAAAGFAQISTSKSNEFSLGIRSDGTLWAWGANGSSQLGDGTTTSRPTPVQIGAATNWKYVSAGGLHSVATRTDGTLWAWGLNSSGQLGDGTTTTRTAPTQVGTSTLWAIVAAGDVHSAAVRNDGTIWTWGANTNGQLGNGSTDSIAHPSPSAVGSTFSNAFGAVSAGTDFTLAVKGNGTLWSCGLNSTSQLGDGTSTTRTSLTQIGVATTWNTVSAGQAFAIARRTDGTLWRWGNNAAGQLGSGSVFTFASPVQLGTDTNWQSAVAGATHVLAIKTDGTLWSWGANALGQLGLGFADIAVRGTVPVQVGTDTRWVRAAAGAGFSLATKSDGTLWSWGGNASGQLGSLPRVPLPVSRAFGPVAAAAGGGNHTLMVRADGTLWTCGSNTFGQLGIGSADASPHPVPSQITPGNSWASVSAGTNFSLALDTYGALWAWGFGGGGQLGDGTGFDRTAPVKIGTESWASVSAGGGHSLGIRGDGTLWAWGTNSSYQLGDATQITRLAPVVIGADSDWRSVHASANGASLAIKNNGTLWSWGFNGNGQLGDGSITNRPRPAQLGNATWRSVAPGGFHTVGIRIDGTLWAWGLNSSGQLGDGTITQRTTPVQIGTATNWIAVSAGASHSAAVAGDGSLWTWGSNTAGTLGDGTFASSLTPKRVGTSTAWLSLPQLGGAGHTLAVTADGTLWGFGYGGSGQTGFAGRNQFLPDLVQPALSSPAQTVSFPAVGAVAIGSTAALNGASSSGLPVTYMATGPGTVANGRLTVTGPGLITLIAYQAGDSFWQSSGPAVQYVNPPAPVVSADAASNITTTGATLTGLVNPKGVQTTAKFQSGLNTGYGLDSAIALHPANGAAAQAVSADLTGLAPGTTYHYHLVATNSFGNASDSGDLTFTTISTDARLASLTPSAGTLTPGFSNSITAYALGIADTAAGALTFTPGASHPQATLQLRVNGGAYSAVVSGAAATLPGLHVGANTVDVLVTAQDGVTPMTYTVTITVLDTTPPTIGGTFAPLILTTGANATATLPDYTGQAVTSDNVGVTSVTQAPVLGAVPVGTVHVVLTARDAANNSASTGFDVEVRDGTPPTLTVPANQIAEAGGPSGAAVNYPLATASDNATALPTIGYSKASGSVFALGTTTVTVTASDAAGNTATGSFTVLVRDTTAPVLTLPANQTIEATSAAGAMVNYPPATATDAVTLSPAIVYSKLAGAAFALGTTTVNVTATDAAGNIGSGSFTVLVRDTTTPAITTAPADRTLAAGANGKAALPNLTGEVVATDNVAVLSITQSPVAGTLLSYGQTPVTITVSDAAGNASTALVHITVADQTPPIVTAPGGGFTPVSIATGPGGTAALPDYASQATASDNVGVNGAIVQTPAPGTPVGIGVVHVVLTATDGAANAGTLGLDVTVTDGTAPVLSGPLGGFSPLNVPTGQAGTVALPDFAAQASATDNVAVVGGITQTPAAGAVKPAGTVAVTLSAQDAAGNTGRMILLVNVNDGTLPVFTKVPPDRTLAAGANGTAPLPDLTIEAAARDRLGAPVTGLFQSPAAATALPLGLQNIPITVRDDAGNTASVMVHITVTDQTVPVVQAPAPGSVPLSIATGANGTAPLPDYATQATATDNVGVTGGITQSPVPGTPQLPGNTVVTLTAHDAAGNAGTLTFTIPVTDGTPPAIVSAPPNRTLNAGATGTAKLPDLTDELIATDNVAVISITQDIPADAELSIGVQDVVVSATDAAQNTTSVTVRITVVDVTAPVLTAPVGGFSPLTTATGALGSAVLPDYTAQPGASDNVGIVGGVTQSPAPGTAVAAGSTHVVLTARDAAGNAATLAFDVIVNDATAPSISGAFTPLILGTNAAGMASLPDYTLQAQTADNVHVKSVTQSPASGASLGAGITPVTLTVTDDAGNTASTAFNVEVRLFPQITRPPQAASIRPAATVTFTVSAAGYGNLSYQWVKDGADLPGETRSSLTIANAQTANTGLYSVRVSNSLGTATSSAARLRLVAWGDIDGTYQALLLHDNTAAPAESPYPGRFTVTLSAAGSMTGKLEYRGLTHAFAGRFTPELDYVRTIVRVNQPSLQLRMHLDADAFKLTALISEVLSAPATYESGAVLPLHTVHTVKVPAAQKGRYTARLNPPANVAAGPTAGGFAMVDIVASGAVTITGKLPDGTALSSGALLQDDGVIAFYNRLYTATALRAGYLAGPVTFNPAGGVSAVLGALDWRKPTQLTGLFAAGFQQSLTLEGSAYIAPLTGQRALTLQDAAGTLESSFDGALYPHPVHLSMRNLFTVDLPNSGRLSLTATRLTGAVTGRFYDTVAGKYRALSGVVLQAQGEFSGFYPAADHAAEWWVAPH
jgi:uncharacterized repeat protein (TIGR03803 family)